MSTPNLAEPAQSAREPTLTEKRETTVRLNEPLKLKVVKRTGGHAIEWTVNLNWSQVDTMLAPEGPLLQAISNTMQIIEGAMKSRLVDVKEVED